MASLPVLNLLTLFFKHLVWILGLKPGVGGALKPGRAVEGPSTVSNAVSSYGKCDYHYWHRQEHNSQCL